MPACANTFAATSRPLNRLAFSAGAVRDDHAICKVELLWRESVAEVGIQLSLRRLRGCPATAVFVLLIAPVRIVIPNPARQLGVVHHVLEFSPALGIAIVFHGRHAHFAEGRHDGRGRVSILQRAQQVRFFTGYVVQGQLDRLLSEQLLQVVRDDLRRSPAVGLIDLKVQPHPVGHLGREQWRRQIDLPRSTSDSRRGECGEGGV